LDQCFVGTVNGIFPFNNPELLSHKSAIGCGWFAGRGKWGGGIALACGGGVQGFKEWVPAGALGEVLEEGYRFLIPKDQENTHDQGKPKEMRYTRKKNLTTKYIFHRGEPPTMGSQPQTITEIIYSFPFL
jgi:hypothetical protein